MAVRRVVAEIECLKAREREAFDLWLDEEISQSEFSIELERAAIHRHLLMCMALVAGEGGEVPDLSFIRAVGCDWRGVGEIAGVRTSSPKCPIYIISLATYGHQRIAHIAIVDKTQITIFHLRRRTSNRLIGRGVYSCPDRR